MSAVSAERPFDPEKLRPVLWVAEPDPRNQAFVRLDRTDGTMRPMELADHHDDVAAFVLHAGVPEDIVMQFETVKNLYLYAWFVYRFYPVADHENLACLELALRTRLEEEIRTGKIKQKPKPTLRPLLEYAVKHGLIRNEGFEIWRNRGVNNARRRMEMEKTREMMEKNLAKIAWDESEIEVLPQDLEWDYVKILVETLPYMRNGYAHGSTSLHNQSLHTIQLVCEIINQLFDLPKDPTPKEIEK